MIKGWASRLSKQGSSLFGINISWLSSLIRGRLSVLYKCVISVDSTPVKKLLKQWRMQFCLPRFTFIKLHLILSCKLVRLSLARPLSIIPLSAKQEPCSAPTYGPTPSLDLQDWSVSNSDKRSSLSIIIVDFYFQKSFLMFGPLLAPAVLVSI